MMERFMIGTIVFFFAIALALFLRLFWIGFSVLKNILF